MRLRISPEVEQALETGARIVALETTLLAHGFPRPDNLEVARAMVAAVREAGAVPATVAVVDGVVKVGLDPSDLERLGGEDTVVKCSLRDLAYVVATGGLGATTVAATARIAAQAGIGVFATGGIGGVHPRADGPADISADLYELARTRIAVVSAGAKSILDLPATLEMLESLGITVIGFGCDEFPAFHAASSGLKLRQRADDVETLARVVRAQSALDLPGAVLVCHPPPAELALSADELAALVAAARAQADEQGVGGAALTPALLAAMDRLSEGRTGRINRALAIANAGLGGRLAVAIAHAAAVD